MRYIDLLGINIVIINIGNTKSFKPDKKTRQDGKNYFRDIADYINNKFSQIAGWFAAMRYHKKGYNIVFNSQATLEDIRRSLKNAEGFKAFQMQK